jgi:N-acetylmuramoyl-L-alanine amidase
MSWRKLPTLAFVVILMMTAGLLAEPPHIQVIYPKENQRIAAVDSTFIFGNVTPGSKLEINADSIKVYDNGAFLAYLPIASGSFIFHLRADLERDSAVLDLPVQVPERYIAPPRDSLKIVRGYEIPAQNIGLTVADLLELSFRGTPGCVAYAKLSTDSALIPMTEEQPSEQTYWGSELFGGGDVPDSVLVRGAYFGVLTLQRKHISDSTKISYILCRELLVPQDSSRQLRISDTTGRGCVSIKSDVNLTVFDSDSVRIGELIDSVQTIRTGPRKGYLSIFQPKGIRFRITGFYENYLRAQLAPGQIAWMPDSSIKMLPEGARLPQGEVVLVRTTKTDDGVTVSFAVGAKVPFRVEEDVAVGKFYLDLYNCTSNIDWIRYDHTDSLIRTIRWSQPQVQVMRLAIDLSEPIWGYDCYYDGTIFNLKLKAIPKLGHDLEGLRIVVDPGHSPDPGAIGPTGFEEKDANYGIAEKLAEILRHRRASVILTRGPDDTVSLYERPEIAYRYKADIYISVHNNALPDGVNPFFNNGTSSYYYHPHSQLLAEAVLDHLLEKSRYPDFGLYYANFAVARPTGYLAILVECAFMIIPEQEQALRSEDFQKHLAEGIAKGVLDFVSEQKDKWR